MNQSHSGREDQRLIGLSDENLKRACEVITASYTASQSPDSLAESLILLTQSLPLHSDRIREADGGPLERTLARMMRDCSLPYKMRMDASILYSHLNPFFAQMDLVLMLTNRVNAVFALDALLAWKMPEKPYTPAFELHELCNFISRKALDNARILTAGQITPGKADQVVWHLDFQLQFLAKCGHHVGRECLEDIVVCASSYYKNMALRQLAEQGAAAIRSVISLDTYRKELASDESSDELAETIDQTIDIIVMAFIRAPAEIQKQIPAQMRPSFSAWAKASGYSDLADSLATIA
jgi:hypothetical protein